MKNQFIVTSILLLILSITSCKKVKQDEIDAGIYVKEYQTGTPLANAKVVITKGAPASGIGTIEVATLFTNSDGKVDYNAENLDEDYMYYAEAYKDTYFDTHDNQVSVTRGEKNFTTTIYMYAESYVKLHVKNVNPFNQIDLIQLQSFCHPNLYFQGINIDTIFLYCDYDYVWMGNFPNYAYSALVTKNNQSFTVPYSFLPIPHDTITVNINY